MNNLSKWSSIETISNNLIDADLRNYWSTGTNTKEWILLELQEPGLLSQIRIHNKSVLEWEVAVGLRYKPETFVKVRPRCEAPRRDMIYPMNYTPCRYVRLSCLRGSPIAIFFIQLIGISVPGLEPEFQPVVNYLLPQIVAHEQDTHSLHFQLLQDITDRLHVYLPQIEAEVVRYGDDTETITNFIAMLAGPFYPILQIVTERPVPEILCRRFLNGRLGRRGHNASPPLAKESREVNLCSSIDANKLTETLFRIVSKYGHLMCFVCSGDLETARCSSSGIDSELSKSSQSAPPLTVSSNFEPRKPRSTSSYPLTTSRSVVFCPDSIFKLLRKAFVDKDLGVVCKVASKIIYYLSETALSQEESIISTGGRSSLLEEAPGLKLPDHTTSIYSEMFGDDFVIPFFDWDPSYTNVLDIGAVEEGIVHVLYACAVEPLLCSKLAGSVQDFCLALPLIQALLPALRPVNCLGSVDDTFSQWGQLLVQQSLSKIVSTLCSSAYHPLLLGCAGYLSSFSPSHVKTACVLIDLCSSALTPWLPQITAKIDLAVELLEDLLGVIQGERHSLVRVRAALEYLVLALSGYMDNVLAEYKEAKLRILFLLEMLENFLEPAFAATQNMVGHVEFSSSSSNNPETICVIALHLIHAAVKKPSVLPYLELEWRLGSVPPSVLLSILDPHLQLPPEVDHYRPSESEKDTSSCFPLYSESSERSSLKSSAHDDGDAMTDATSKVDILEDASLLFAPKELTNLTLPNGTFENGLQLVHSDLCYEKEQVLGFDPCDKLIKGEVSGSGSSIKYFSLHLDHSHVLDFEVCKSRSSEFRRLALDLHSQENISHDGHNAAIDALILSAECYIDPFMISNKEYPMVSDHVRLSRTNVPRNMKVLDLRKALKKGRCNLETISRLEQKRDRAFIEILLEAAEMDRIYYQKFPDKGHCPYGAEAEEELGSWSEKHAASADAVTLVRRNQVLLCNFLIHQLRREQKSFHETLMQCLVFLLHSATKLGCSPEIVIDIILESAEHFNVFLTSIPHQSKEGNLLLSPEKLYRVQRHWTILQSLIIASSGGGCRLKHASGLQYSTLIPQSIWVLKIPRFSSCAFPLVRYLGWMAISMIAKEYLTQRLFLTSTLSQLSQLLSIFADDLVVMGCDQDFKEEGLVPKLLQGKQATKMLDKLPSQRYSDFSFAVKHPDLSIFFPDMPKELKAFRECILEAVALQLRSVVSSKIPDILCWLSDLCLSPFLEKTYMANNNFPSPKGFLAKNAKAVVFYVFEAIISEHMEAVVPELPRLMQVLGSLCRSFYCDVPFLCSIFRLLKPIIAYSLRKVLSEEKHLSGESCIDFESLCFSELFACLQQEREKFGCSIERVNIPLVMFILAYVSCDMSFDRKREILQLSVQWVDFPDFEPTSSFDDYLRAFQQLLQSCIDFSVQTLQVLGFVPMPEVAALNRHSHEDKSFAWFPDDFCYCNGIIEPGKQEKDISGSSSTYAHGYHLSSEELEGFSVDIFTLISKLIITIESCWNLHPQLCRSLVVLSAQCLVYSKFLSSVTLAASDLGASKNTCKSFDEFFIHWNIGIEALAENIMLILEKGCWEVASTMVDCLLRIPPFCSLDGVVGELSSVIGKIMLSAPRISWRLRTNSWLSELFSRGILLNNSGICLVELISKMLSHPEPEQRFTALMQLGRLLGLDVNGGWLVLSSPSFDKIASHDSVVSISESVLSQLVSNTWDPVAFMASADTSLHLRTLAKALLVHYIPFAEHAKLRSFLESADTFFPSMGNFAYPMGDSMFAQISLALIAGVFLYCPAEDLSLVPPNVWRHIEILGQSKSETVGDLEKRICQALCKVKHEEEDAKAALKEALCSCSTNEFDPAFGSTRESVLQVLANLTSIQSYLDLFAEQMDKEATELEEAELEMDILQNEVTLHCDARDGNELPYPSDSMTDDHRLQKIKNDIRSLEKSRLKEEIIARRQKKMSLRQERQKSLEEATVREAELLQELDRQRTLEVEKEIERQRMLELERAKTNELRHSLELEKERQSQREIQRELDQVESGGRQPQREYSSSTQISRPRDRYRDRDNGRSSGDGSSRASNTSFTSDVPVNSQSVSTPHAVVLSGSRSFTGQLPTILQSRDRGDDCSSNYDESFDVSRDSGDTSSTGDPEASGLDGAFGSSQRHGSRGGKSRQILERRDRDSRREGKWERKH